MAILSGIKKVKEILGRAETDIYDKVCGRVKAFPLDENRTYIIPEYQREIAWSAENVQILIDDLRDGSKFLGSITVSTNEAKKFEVMDGQQRLTVLMMIVTYLNKVLPVNKQYKELCLIKNNSFPNFNEVLRYEFDYEKIEIENKALYNEILLNDQLDQKENLKEIWECIEERVNSFSEMECVNLMIALLESDVNIIINEIEDTDTKRKFCVDCFIDTNNKGEALYNIDIIRAYAFKEDFECMAKKWGSIQRRCHKLRERVKYSREELFFQYFICKVNEEIGYSISKLSDNYEIRENVIVNGKKYSAGTHVWYMFKNDSFYSKLLGDLNSYLDFIEIVISSEDGRTDSFKKYFRTENGGLADETRIVNAHSIINAILRNDDVVPKMMMLKYFLEVLKPEQVKNNKYKIINQINLIANVFTMSNKRKGSEQIAGKLLQKNWEQALRDLADNMMTEIPGGIGFAKIAKSNKKYTVESGQHLAKRYIAMRDAYKFNNNGFSVNEDLFKNINSTNIDKNIEHFIVNRKFVYALYQEDGKTVDIELPIPGKYKKYIATIANYLILNSSINTELGNRPVYEKIEILEEKIKEKGLDYVLPSRRSQMHYYLIKKVFHDESRYPAQALAKSSKKKEKREILKGYYLTHFEDEFTKLVTMFNNEDCVLAAELEDGLLKRNFVKDPLMQENGYKFEGETLFASVCAEVDIKRRKLIMSAEKYNPTYGEENDSYAELLDKIAEKFEEIFAKEPCIRSSDEWGGSDDVSCEFIYEFDWDIKNVDEFLTALHKIDAYCEIAMS